jgi:hypothetical protein
MGWRRSPRTLNEALLAERPREAAPKPAAAPEGRQQARARLMRLGLWVTGALLLLGLKWIVEFLPSWAQIVVGALVVGHLVAFFLGSTRRRSSDAGKGVRAVFVLWLAICVAATVLVAIGGFQQDDRALLGLIWPILALIWIGYRLRVGTATPQPGTDSRFRSR